MEINKKREELISRHLESMFESDPDLYSKMVENRTMRLHFEAIAEMAAYGGEFPFSTLHENVVAKIARKMPVTESWKVLLENI